MKTIDFKKYIRTKEDEKAHALYSPSGMDRTLGCPGSVNQIQKVKRKLPSHPASGLGVNAHTLLEFFIKEGSAGISALNSAAAIPFKKHIGYSSEQHQAVRKAHEFVRSEYIRMYKEHGVKPNLLVERKVHLEDTVNADCNGTADIIMYQLFGVLHIMDYKNGKAFVDADNNKQMMTYALGFLEELGWDFSEVWVTIIQPNASQLNYIRTWKTTIKRMESFKHTLIAGIKASKHKDAKLVEDPKWCFFCPARMECPAKMLKAKEKIKDRFKQRR